MRRELALVRLADKNALLAPANAIASGVFAVINIRLPGIAVLVKAKIKTAR